MKKLESGPSTSIMSLNVPEIQEFVDASFVYNYYLKDEKINIPPAGILSTHSLENLPRYVKLNWEYPAMSEREFEKPNIIQQRVGMDPNDGINFYSVVNKIERNYKAGKVIYEDDFSPNFISHTFSDVSAIEQGSSDLENFSRMFETSYESVSKMGKEQAKAASDSAGDSKEKIVNQNLVEVTKAYTKLADFPKNSLGLRVYDATGKKQIADQSEFLSSIANDLSLHVQINGMVIPDLFANSDAKSDESLFETLKEAHSNSALNVGPVTDESVLLPIIGINENATPYQRQALQLLGYIITRYKVSPKGFVKEKVIFVESPSVTSKVDPEVLYGATYLYTISAVYSLSVLIEEEETERALMGDVMIASRPIPKTVECFEYTPPPEPEDINFVYDYEKKNLLVTWDMPVNPQGDVVQFQVMRRKTINHPFELIAQYCFDGSLPAANRTKTGEKVDGNNYQDMQAEYRYLVKKTDKAVFYHVDEDFAVDAEFAMASSYIYAVCSVDAHGMISNYSAQHQVTFDPYKNRIVSKVVCESGSPRPYPNMKMSMDAFKDVMKIEGQNCTKMSIYFTPEYLNVEDEDGRSYKIVEGDAPAEKTNPYYVLQLINLDNQKTQQIRIKIKDPQNLTV